MGFEKQLVADLRVHNDTRLRYTSKVSFLNYISTEETLMYFYVAVVSPKMLPKVSTVTKIHTYSRLHKDYEELSIDQIITSNIIGVASLMNG